MVENRDDSASVNADLLPSRLSHVEMFKRRVTPSAIVVWESVVWWAKIGGRHRHRRPFNAPPWIRLVITHHLETLTTRRAVVEQRGAQRRRLCSITRLVQIPIPTSSTYNHQHSQYIYVYSIYIKT